MKIAVAIPCYNCEPQISRVLAELFQIAASTPELQAVYVIDNRSSDNTIDTALDLKKTLPTSPELHIHRNFVNAGLGGTHKIALSLAQQNHMTHLLILHGDHQATALDIPQLILKARQNNGETVLGSRFMDLRKLSGYSLTRTWGNIVLNILYTLISGRRVRDLGSGLNLFRLSELHSSDYQSFDNGFTFNMDLLLYLIRRKTQFHYIPIRWSTTDQISNARALNVGLKTLYKILPWLLRRKPINTPHYETERLA